MNAELLAIGLCTSEGKLTSHRLIEPRVCEQKKPLLVRIEILIALLKNDDMLQG